MIVYTEDETLVLARSVYPHIQTNFSHIRYAYEIALELRGITKRADVPEWVRNFVTLCPFDEVPRFMRHQELKTLIEWRLKIGK